MAFILHQNLAGSCHTACCWNVLLLCQHPRHSLSVSCRKGIHPRSCCIKQIYAACQRDLTPGWCLPPQIRLIANPMVQSEELDSAGGARPLHLFSKPISTTHYAKYSRHQVVGFTWRMNTYDSVWQVSSGSA